MFFFLFPGHDVLGGPTENQDTPSVTLNYHNRKCGHVLFHPTAENVVLSTGADLLIKLYDIEKGAEKLNIAAHSDLINSVTFNWEGNLIATTSKDKKLRIIDLRSGKVTQQADAHTGVKGARVLWLGEKNKLITTGFSKTSDRQVSILVFCICIMSLLSHRSLTLSQFELVS